MSTPPPGWHADPALAHDPRLPAGALRWWDGTAWTEHTHVPAPPVPAAPVAAFAPVFAPSVVAPGPATGSAQVVAQPSTSSAAGPARHDQAKTDASAVDGTLERNPFSRLALVFGITTVAAAALVAVAATAGVVAVVAGLLALVFGILGIVRSVRTHTGRTASVWGIVLGPVGVVLAGVVWIAALIAMTPGLSIPGVDYVPPMSVEDEATAVSNSAERMIMIDLTAAAVEDPASPYPESVECPERVTEDRFPCTITYEDGSTNLGFVSLLPSNQMVWQPAELGEVGG